MVFFITECIEFGDAGDEFELIVNRLEKKVIKYLLPKEAVNPREIVDLLYPVYNLCI